MTSNTEHPFDPSLRPYFSGTAYLAAEPYRKGSRELFYTLMHVSEQDAIYPVVYDFLRQQLTDFAPADAIPSLHSNMEEAMDSLALPGLSEPIELNDQSLRNCLLQISPVVLTEPGWLQSISQAATSQNPLAIDLMAVYLTLTDKETLTESFQSLVRTAGIDLPPLTSRAFAQEEAIGACLFDLAATQLALSCFPRVFFPEILGFTLAYCRSPSILENVRNPDSHHGLSRHLHLSRNLKNSVLPALGQIIDDYLTVFSGQTDALRRRIRSGFRLYRSHMEQCCRHLRHQLQNPPSVHELWTKLLQSKAPSAFGHHRKIKLAGRSLDDWFAKSPFDSAGFVAALRQSSYVDAEHPENSRLLKLFDFNGPMFGVLTEEERTLLERWLSSENSGTTIQTAEAGKPSAPVQLNDNPHKPPIDFSNLGSRELYHYLVNADLYPEVLATARQKARKVLRTARRFNRIPFKPYSHRAFENHIAHLYRNEVDSYQPLEVKPKLSKEAYLWGIEQFAPAILTDGCWLQAVAQLKYHSNRAIGALLFKIYDDETGNGRLERNHPFIYQSLLNSIWLDLPPITSRKFIEYEGFIDSAFDLPVYLLSISKHPVAFLPELLGLNMAIELSGLGNVYLRLSEEMAFWGFDPAIVDIHVSIDNVSSGHAFLAQKAIQLHLDDIAAGLGQEAVASHWRRIYDGYCSLQSVCRGFTFALVSRYLLNRITKKRSRQHH